MCPSITIQTQHTRVRHNPLKLSWAHPGLSSEITTRKNTVLQPFRPPGKLVKSWFFQAGNILFSQLGLHSFVRRSVAGAYSGLWSRVRSAWWKVCAPWPLHKRTRTMESRKHLLAPTCTQTLPVKSEILFQNDAPYSEDISERFKTKDPAKTHRQANGALCGARSFSLPAPVHSSDTSFSTHLIRNILQRLRVLHLVNSRTGHFAGMSRWGAIWERREVRTFFRHDAMHFSRRGLLRNFCR